MPVLTILPAGKKVDVLEGSSVLEAILAAGEVITTKCSGNAQCGSCHIFIHEGRKGLSRIQKAENEKLDGIVGITSKSRLACQITFGTEDATIELLGFSSGV